MHGPIAFLLAVVVVLLTPGPTNTLLATAGATEGARRSVGLLLAEVAGYLVSVSTLLFLVGPEVAKTPALSTLLRGTSALCLFYLATQLWRRPGSDAADPSRVGFRQVFTTTLLNPKGLVFAFAIFPPVQTGRIAAALPYLGMFAVSIVAVGSGWLALGSALGRGLLAERASRSLLPQRIGAGALCLFGVLLCASLAYRP